MTASFRRSFAAAAILLVLIGSAAPLARPSGIRAQAPVQVLYHAGWNLVAGPSGTRLSGVDGDLLTLAAGGATYESIPASTPLTGGAGYWAYFAADTQVPVPVTPAQAQNLSLTAGSWTIAGNSSSQPVRLSGADEALGFDPTQGYTSLTVLSAGRAALVYSASGGTLVLAPLPDTILSLPSADPTAAAVTSALPASAALPAAQPASGSPAGVEVLATGFGQAKPGGPVTVAALVRNDGPAVDTTPVTITVYDAGGTVIAARDSTLHYLASGETTGFVQRLTAQGSGAAAAAQIEAGNGRPASDPLPGELSFSQMSLMTNRTGIEASAVLTSTYASDLSTVRVDAIAYDGHGTIIGGGEALQRLVPAGDSIGVLIALDVSAPPARVDLYANLP